MNLIRLSIFQKANPLLDYYSDKTFPIGKVIGITLLFFLISLIGINHHEIWSDESHNFLLGRDSNSLIDLYNNTRYEGHPLVWTYLMYLITRFSSNPFHMQLLHIIISSSVVFIFLKNAPFKLWFKIAFLLSYFMLYEYTVISRNYSLGVLFLFISCTLYAKRKERFTTFCFFLALCSNTHAIFTIVSSTLLFSIFIEQIYELKKTPYKSYWKGYIIFFIGFFLSYLQIIPASDTTFFERVDYFDAYETVKSGMSLFKALFPIVDFQQIHYWNKFYFIEHFRTISLLVGALVWIIPLLFFNKNKYVLLFVYTTIFGFIVFVLITQMHGIRYNGLLFITLIAGLWILPSQKHKPLFKKKLSRFNSKIILFLMSTQVIGGILAYSLDIKNTFNSGEKIANYIQENNIPVNQIMAYCDSASINAYLNENLYNLCYQKSKGFYLWNVDCSSLLNISDEELIKSVFLKNTNYKIITLILAKPMKTFNSFSFNGTTYNSYLLKEYKNTAAQGYYIYKIYKHEAE